MDSTSEPAKSDTVASASKKSGFETVITLTPVVLTVLATVLAGRSVGEMTQAQYHRSVAGQNQSKVGDQWAFFQAKKIRATEMEMTTDRIPVSFKPVKLEPEHVEICGDRLRRALETAHASAESLVSLSKDTGEARAQAAASAFSKRISANGAAPSELQEQLGKALKEQRAKGDGSVFTYFVPNKLPKADDVTADNEDWKEAANDADIAKAAKAIADREPEQKIAELTRNVKVDRLHLAIDASEAQGKAFETKCDPFNDVIKNINELIGGQVKLAAECHLAALVVAATSFSDSKAKKAAEEFIEDDKLVQVAAQELNDMFKAATHDYNQRRYTQEAKYNQRTAALYEVQVHHSSMLSDNHLERSKMFSYAMMATQAGVAIASLALAARRRSMLWLLAALVGIAALGYSAWVFKSTMVP
jgi:hypothetical protein